MLRTFFIISFSCSAFAIAAGAGVDTTLPSVIDDGVPDVTPQVVKPVVPTPATPETSIMHVLTGPEIFIRKEMRSPISYIFRPATGDARTFVTMDQDGEVSIQGRKMPVDLVIEAGILEFHTRLSTNDLVKVWVTENLTVAPSPDGLKIVCRASSDLFTLLLEESEAGIKVDPVKPAPPPPAVRWRIIKMKKGQRIDSVRTPEGMVMVVKWPDDTPDDKKIEDEIEKDIRIHLLHGHDKGPPRIGPVMPESDREHPYEWFDLVGWREGDIALPNLPPAGFTAEDATVQSLPAAVVPPDVSP
jgi:hypothetical protein